MDIDYFFVIIYVSYFTILAYFMKYLFFMFIFSCVDFRYFLFIFIMAMVHTNIKVIPYIIFHDDIYEYVKCKLRILLCIIFHNNKGG